MCVSFDVKALFPSVPIDIAIIELKNWLLTMVNPCKDLGEDKVNGYIELVELCMRRNEFVFRNHFYKQTQGTSMGIHYLAS